MGARRKPFTVHTIKLQPELRRGASHVTRDGDVGTKEAADGTGRDLKVKTVDSRHLLVAFGQAATGDGKLSIRRLHRAHDGTLCCGSKLAAPARFEP